MTAILRVRQFAQQNDLLGDTEDVKVHAFICIETDGKFTGLDVGSGKFLDGFMVEMLPPPNRTSGIAPFLPRENIKYIFETGEKRDAYISEAEEAGKEDKIFLSIVAFLKSKIETVKALTDIKSRFKDSLAYDKDKDSLWFSFKVNGRPVHTSSTCVKMYSNIGEKITCAVTGEEDTKVSLADKRKSWQKAQLVSHNNSSRCPIGLESAEDFALGRATSTAFARTLKHLKNHNAFQRLDDRHIAFFWTTDVIANQAVSEVDEDLFAGLFAKTEEEDAKQKADSNFSKAMAAPHTKGNISSANKIAHVLILNAQDYICSPASYHEIDYNSYLQTMQEWRTHAQWNGRRYTLSAFVDKELQNTKDYKLEVYKTILLGKEFSPSFKSRLAERLIMNTLSSDKENKKMVYGQLAFSNYIRRGKMNTQMEKIGRLIAICGSQQYRQNETDGIEDKAIAMIKKNPKHGVGKMLEHAKVFDRMSGIDKEKAQLVVEIGDISTKKLTSDDIMDLMRGYYSRIHERNLAIEANKKKTNSEE